VQTPAQAHSLTSNVSTTISVGETKSLGNTTGGCSSTCIWTYSAIGWPGSVSVSGMSLLVTAPSSIGASSSGPFTVTLVGNKNNGDTYTTNWAVTIVDPNWGVTPPTTPTPPTFNPGPNALLGVFTVIYDSVTNGGQSVTPGFVNFIPGSLPLTPPTPQPRTGYDFQGWYTSPTGGGKISAPFVPITSMTIYAQWTPKSYIITCDSTTNGGQAVSPTTITYTVGQPGVSCATPVERTGYTLNGWFTAANGGSKVAFPVVATGNATYYAQWTKVEISTPVPTPTLVSSSVSVVVYFCYDCRKLGKNARSDLLEFLNSVPSNAINISVKVTGYAQVGRSSSYDEKLSLDRAEAVSKFLKREGLNSDISMAGLGWDDDTAQSRRAEVEISYQIQQ